jgi:hypothetical protein
MDKCHKEQVRSQSEMATALIACVLLSAGVSVTGAQELSGQSVFMPDLSDKRCTGGVRSPCGRV